jgi:hypothetical protein
VGYTEDFADGSGGYDGNKDRNGSRGRHNKEVGNANCVGSLLTDFTSNPAIPAKLNPTNWSAKTLFIAFYFPFFFS